MDFELDYDEAERQRVAVTRFREITAPTAEDLAKMAQVQAETVNRDASS